MTFAMFKFLFKPAILLAFATFLLVSIRIAAAKPRPAIAVVKPVLVPQIGNFKGIGSLAYSPDGATLATMSEDSGPLLIWNARTLELKRVLHGLDANGPVQWTPDPNVLALSSGQSDAPSVRLLDARTGRMTREIPGARLLDNGRVLARYSKAGVTLSEIANGKLLAKLPMKKANESVIADDRLYFAPDHRHLAWTTDGEAQIFALPQTRPRLTLRDARGMFGGQAGVFGPVAFSPDNRLIATGGEDPMLFIPDDDGPNTEAKYAHSLTVKIWDARTGKLLRVLPGYGYSLGEGVSLLRFTPDSRRLLIGVESKIDLLDAHTFKVLRSTQARSPFAVAPDGVHLLSGGYVGGRHFAQLFDLRTGKVKRDLPAALGVINVCEWSQDGRQLLIGDNYRDEVRLWNVHKAKSGVSWRQPAIAQGGYLPDGNVWTANLQEAQIHDATTGALLDTFKPHATDSSGLSGLLVSPDGKYYVTQRYKSGSPIELYDRQTKALALSLDEPNAEVRTVAFSPDGQQIAAVASPAFKPSVLYIWSINGRLLHTFSDGAETDETIYIYNVRFSPDGKQLYATGQRGPRAYDLETGARRPLGTTWVGTTDFSADGRYLVSAGNNITDIFNARTGQLVRRFAAPTYFDDKAALSPDNNLLARAEGGRTMLYEAKTGRKLLTLVSMPIRDETKAPTDWLIYAPDQFYNASPGAASRLRWRVGNAVYPAAKFAAKFQNSAHLKAIIAATSRN